MTRIRPEAAVIIAAWVLLVLGIWQPWCAFAAGVLYAGCLAFWFFRRGRRYPDPRIPWHAGEHGPLVHGEYPRHQHWLDGRITREDS